MHPRRSVFRRLRAAVCIFGLLAVAMPALGQTPAPPDPQPAPPGPPPEIELNLINLPTTLSIRRHHSYFRLTHRFLRDLGRGSLGQLASDLFSLDEGAVIGFEYRFGLFSNVQLGVHRSLLNKTIQTFGRWDAIRQGDSSPVAVSTTLSYEGGNNLRERHIPAVGVTVSRTFGNRLALYGTPAFVGRTHAADTFSGHEEHDTGPSEHAEHSDTWIAGIGARVRFLRAAYLVAEYTPRIHGYDPNADTWGVAIERLTHGHTLQLCFTNTLATTPGWLARGGNEGQMLLGFNITRKF